LFVLGTTRRPEVRSQPRGAKIAYW